MLKYLEISQNGNHRCQPIDRCLKIGSARSNDVVIVGRNVLPVHSLVVDSGVNVIVENLFDRKSFPLGNKPISIQDCEIQICPPEEFWQKYRKEIESDFDEWRRTDQSKGFQDTVTKLELKWTGGKTFPSSWTEALLRKMKEAGLQGPVERLLLDTEITDILINRFDEIWFEKKGQLVRSSDTFSDSLSFEIYLENLLSHQGKRIDDSKSFIDFKMPDGSRAHLVKAPLSDFSYLSIRKPKEELLKIDDLERLGAITENQKRSLNRALQEGLNILVAGATGSGKTTLLKSLIQDLPTDERVLVLEDTPEIRLARENTLYLCTQEIHGSRLSPIDLKTLVRQALRMRPNRIVIGEVRGGEALDLLMAMNTGHRGCMGAIHSNSCSDSLDRLLMLAAFQSADSVDLIRKLIAQNLNLVLFMDRLSDGRRKLVEMKELKGLYQDRWILNDFI